MPVHNELETLEKNLMEQRELIGQLEERLGYVLRHEGETFGSDPDQEDMPLMSPLGTSVYGINNRVKLQTQALKEILERLDI